MNHAVVKGYFFIIASAVIFGCMPLGVKLVYADGVNSLSTAVRSLCSPVITTRRCPALS